ncbi:MAG TPA: proton-conducting transporter membrane subunit [Hyphomicrobiaceae bacterium]|nr:proton-conducting transporter membrane subunit [Hyphomicrobiaceae bacterium]
MTRPELWLGATLAVPFAMVALCLARSLRDRMPGLLMLAPLPALAASLSVADTSQMVLPGALLGLTFLLDEPGAMLLGSAALLWSVSGAYAHPFLSGRAHRGRFATWWLMTLAGNLGVFMSADLVSFYVLFTLATLAAYGLIVHDGTSASRRAGAVYIALAVLGEALLLMAFVLLAAGSAEGSLAIRDAVAALPTSPWRDSARALLVLGFGLKIGLVPLHVWMPLTYSAAPIPAAAVLSGAAVNAGVIGLIRFLPFDAGLPDWGGALAAAGLISAFAGAGLGITQTNPRTVLAYSSVSQMGLIAAVLGMGLTIGSASAPKAAAFYAVHHALAKGGLFLAVGVAALTNKGRLWPVLLPAAVIALALAGLPLTGGALAKSAIKAPLGEGLAGTLATLSAITSTLLMLHFVHCLTRSGHTPTTRAPPGLVICWLAIAFASIAVPWALYPAALGAPLRDALALGTLWEALWPLLVGGALALALGTRPHRLPHVPAGDVLAVVERAAPALRNLAAASERIEGWLRQWPVAGVLLLVLTIALAATLLVGR